MQRGEVITVADRGGDYTGKPRPAVVVQSDLFGAIASVTICPMTSVEADAPLIRLEITPSETLLIDQKSWVAVDKITTVRRNRIGRTIGRLSASDIVRLNGALAVFLGFG